MTDEQTIGKPTTTDKKRKRLTLEEQIARQEELLAKDKESLAKKQQRLRSLNASKMNKDRKEAQKKRNSMLIQLGLWYIEGINSIVQHNGFEFIDCKEETINIDINKVENKIMRAEKIYNKRYNNSDSKGGKIVKKYIIDKNVLLEALNNLKENYLKYGKANINI